MSDAKHQDDAKDVGAPLDATASYAQEKPEVVPELSNVAALGLPNAPELEKKIVRALDMWMLPQLWILYMFNYLNRTNIAQARLNTFNQDLNLKDGDYQTAVAILTVGYMLAQLPSNMLITRVRPNIYLSAAALVWSAVSAATVGCTSAGSLWAVQFVLGIVEAPLFPGVRTRSTSLSISLSSLLYSSLLTFLPSF